MARKAPKTPLREEMGVLESLYSTLERLESAEIASDQAESLDLKLSVSELTSIARAKKELSLALRTERAALKQEAQESTAEEQAKLLVEMIADLPREHQVSVLRSLHARLTPAVVQEAALQ